MDYHYPSEIFFHQRADFLLIFYFYLFFYFLISPLLARLSAGWRTRGEEMRFAKVPGERKVITPQERRLTTFFLVFFYRRYRVRWKFHKCDKSTINQRCKKCTRYFSQSRLSFIHTFTIKSRWRSKIFLSTTIGLIFLLQIKKTKKNLIKKFWKLKIRKLGNFADDNRPSSMQAAFGRLLSKNRKIFYQHLSSLIEGLGVFARGSAWASYPSRDRDILLETNCKTSEMQLSRSLIACPTRDEQRESQTRTKYLSVGQALRGGRGRGRGGRHAI